MNYESVVSQIERLLSATKFCTLATVDSTGRPHTAQMCVISDGIVIYMQTDSKFEKIKNIGANQNVAINIGGFNFKCTAEIMGHPEKNELFMHAIAAKHPDTKKKYTGLADEVLIKITPISCRQWRAFDGKEGLLDIDFVNKTLSRTIVDKIYE